MSCRNFSLRSNAGLTVNFFETYLSFSLRQGHLKEAFIYYLFLQILKRTCSRMAFQRLEVHFQAHGVVSLSTSAGAPPRLS